MWHWHLPAPGKRRAVQTSAVLVLLIGLLTLIEYGFNLDIGIDQLLFRVAVVGVGDTAPGRMAVHTAVTFVLLGFALLGLDNQLKADALWLTFISCLMPISIVVSFEKINVTQN